MYVSHVHALLLLLLLTGIVSCLHCAVPSPVSSFVKTKRSHCCASFSCCTAAQFSARQPDQMSYRVGWLPCSLSRNSSAKPFALPLALLLLLLLPVAAPCSSSFMHLPQLLVHSCSHPEMSPPHFSVQQVGSSIAVAALLQGSVTV
jgi:hypothetical protein